MISFAGKALGLAESIPIEIFPFEGRGSDRTFFRLKWDEKGSAILVHYDPNRIENTYYADIAIFLRDRDIPVPRLICHDSAACLILMQDLGDMDLWSLRKSPWESRQTLYQKTLTIVRKLHCFSEKDFSSARVRIMEGFGPDLYRWERDYFRNHFVRDLCAIELEPSFERELETELAGLAERLSSTMHGLVHRDLQSRNVMVHDGEPFLIDFQGMRFGSPFYDLGSLLCDPYVDFAPGEVNTLLFYYYELGKRDLDWVTFQGSFWEASAQRLMQALGAYGFLSRRKGLKAFLNHVPAGLRNLRCAAGGVASLARLQELSLVCERVVVDQAATAS